jgi:hypothetical protein
MARNFWIFIFVLGIVAYFGTGFYYHSKCGESEVLEDVKEESNSMRIEIGDGTPIRHRGRKSQVYDSLSYVGFKAKIEDIKYFSDSTAKIFMTYAFWGSDSARIYLHGLDKNGKTNLPNGQSFFCLADEKTGWINFLVPLGEVSHLLFTVTVYTEFGPWLFSKPFSVSAFDPSAVARPIQP